MALGLAGPSLRLLLGTRRRSLLSLLLAVLALLVLSPRPSLSLGDSATGGAQQQFAQASRTRPAPKKLVDKKSIENAIAYQYIVYVESCAMCDVVGSVYQATAMVAAGLYIGFTLYVREPLLTGFAIFVVLSVARVAFAFGDAARGPAMLRALFARCCFLLVVLFFFDFSGGGSPVIEKAAIEQGRHAGLAHYLDWIYEPFMTALIEPPRLVLGIGEMMAAAGSFSTATSWFHQANGLGAIGTERTGRNQHADGCPLPVPGQFDLAQQDASYILSPLVDAPDDPAQGVQLQSRTIGAMLCSLSRMNRMVGLGFLLGAKMAIFDKAGALPPSGQKLLADSLSNADNNAIQAGGGWLLMMLYGLLTVMIVFYFVDTIVAGTILTVTAPFWIGALAFPGGVGFAARAFRFALHAVLTVTFVALAIALVAVLLSYTPAILSTPDKSLSDLSSVLDAVADRDPAMNLSLFDHRFLYLLITPVLGIGLMARASAHAGAWAQGGETGGFAAGSAQHSGAAIAGLPGPLGSRRGRSAIEAHRAAAGRPFGGTPPS